MAIYHTPGKNKTTKAAVPNLERLIAEMEKRFPGFEIVHNPVHKQQPYYIYGQGGLIATGSTLSRALAAALAG